MYRAADVDHDIPVEAVPLARAEPEPDEVDRLFGVMPEA